MGGKLFVTVKGLLDDLMSNGFVLLRGSGWGMVCNGIL